MRTPIRRPRITELSNAADTNGESPRPPLQNHATWRLAHFRPWDAASWSEPSPSLPTSTHHSIARSVVNAARFVVDTSTTSTTSDSSSTSTNIPTTTTTTTQTSTSISTSQSSSSSSASTSTSTSTSTSSSVSSTSSLPSVVIPPPVTVTVTLTDTFTFSIVPSMGVTHAPPGHGTGSSPPGGVTTVNVTITPPVHTVTEVSTLQNTVTVQSTSVETGFLNGGGQNQSGNKLAHNPGAIAGVVVGSVVLVASLLLVWVIFTMRRRRHSTEPSESDAMAAAGFPPTGQRRDTRGLGGRRISMLMADDDDWAANVAQAVELESRSHDATLVEDGTSRAELISHYGSAESHADVPSESQQHFSQLPQLPALAITSDEVVQMGVSSPATSYYSESGGGGLRRRPISIASLPDLGESATDPDVAAWAPPMELTVPSRRRSVDSRRRSEDSRRRSGEDEEQPPASPSVVLSYQEHWFDQPSPGKASTSQLLSSQSLNRSSTSNSSSYVSFSSSSHRRGSSKSLLPTSSSSPALVQVESAKSRKRRGRVSFSLRQPPLSRADMAAQKRSQAPSSAPTSPPANREATQSPYSLLPFSHPYAYEPPSALPALRAITPSPTVSDKNRTEQHGPHPLSEGDDVALSSKDPLLDPRAIFRLRGGQLSSTSASSPGPKDEEDYSRRLGIRADFFPSTPAVDDVSGPLSLPRDQEPR